MNGEGGRWEVTQPTEKRVWYLGGEGGSLTLERALHVRRVQPGGAGG